MSAPRQLGWWARWRAWRRAQRPPRTLKVTRVGRTYIVVTLGVGFGALNTGNNLLYLVLGLLLSLIVASGLLSERALQRLRFRRLLPDAAFAGEPFALRYEVLRLEGRSLALEIAEAEQPALTGSAFVPWVEAGAPVVARSQSVAARRGPLKLRGLKVTTQWPFGLFAKSRVFAVEDQLVIFPRRGFLCEVPPDSAGAEASDLGSPRRREGTGDLLGLKELSEGEDARRVHWLKSAMSNTLLRVEREREDRRQFVLEVDPLAPAQQLEQRCEEAAAVTHQLLARGHEVGLRAGGRKLRPGSGAAQERRVLTALAWLGFEDEAAAKR